MKGYVQAFENAARHCVYMERSQSESRKDEKMSHYDFTVGMIPTCVAGDRIKEGERIAVGLTQLTGEEDLPYGDVHSLLVNQMVSSADYGALAAAMLEYHDHDNLANDLYKAIESALLGYIDSEWYRICGIGSNGEYDPKLVDTAFRR